MKVHGASGFHGLEPLAHGRLSEQIKMIRVTRWAKEEWQDPEYLAMVRGRYVLAHSESASHMISSLQSVSSHS
jgi:hypothetical protein